MNTELGYLPTGIYLTLYYIIISIIGILSFVFIKKDKFSVLLILIYFQGVFDYWGELFNNLSKILIFVLTILLFLEIKKTSRIDLTVIIIFSLFSIVFWFSIFLNHNPFIYSFSHYSNYFIPVIIWIYLINNITNLDYNEYYLKLIYKFILLQVLFSIIKLFTIGFSESVVGSVAFMGGNSATILPVLGYMIISYLDLGKSKVIQITQMASMLLISIMSFKRMIWFIFPTVILALNSSFKYKKYFIYAALLGPLIVYAGIRINPTLNKERKIWGSFDLGYAIEYAQDYYGLKYNKVGRDESYGRLAGNSYMINYVKNNIADLNTWIGYGPKAIYGVSYDEFARGTWKWGVSNKASLTGAARLLIAYGLLGMILYLILIISLFYQNKNRRFRTFIIIFFLFEFFFYLDSLIFLPIIISLLLLSNYLSLRQITYAVNVYQNTTLIKKYLLNNS